MDISLTTWAIAFGVLVLLVCSAFFSGSETALTAVSKARMFQIARNGDRRATIVNALLDRRERLIGGLLLGNNLVNILASAMATTLFLDLFGEAGVVYATLVMTALVVIFSEVLPKTYALGHSDRMSLFVAPAVRVIVALFGPVTLAINAVVRRVLILFGSDLGKGDLLSAHEELRGAIDLHHREGGVVKGDRDMLGGILDLRDLEVSDVMIHRTKIQALSIDDAPEKIVRDVLSSPYTRLPLWQGETENIVGVLHAKDLLRALAAASGDATKLDIISIARPAWFVPDTTTLQDQLNAFLKRKSHFAMVVDEYGEVMGLVTLEDIIEEIVGDIADEHDIVVQGVRPQADGSINVDGSVPIRDLNRAMDWQLPDDEATTIAGLVIHEARMIPEPGQAFTFHGFRFEVLRKSRNRITALKVTPLKKGLRNKPRTSAEPA
ncbi:HlyC/CorC family transporter [Lutibaculum baratangense]|uniref:Co2 transporter containing CBS domains n=1 Tax=Lutibaculum baratangense AMV1 TaxID=631454 RepID=V4RLI4_9HYPH|nr:HlyC/CorC family transporter [Lutibaculum baratangense]ESR24105.1 Co2 transporter containing CBS domains [Lutibaculum baratangense AMV1]